MSADVELDHVTVRVGNYIAVNDANLRVEDGEFFSFLGPSGCGKTTILRTISGFLEPSEGDVRIGGRSMKGTGPNKRPTALIFQNLALFPLMSVADNITYGLRVRGVPGAERRRKADELLELTALHGQGDKKVSELSGGQRQRVVIAGAMVLDPELVVADEPVSMLDVSIRTEILRLMLELRGERELTYLFITHDLSLAWVIADRIAVLYLGKIMEIGLADDVIRRPHHPYTAALVSVSPSPEPPDPGTRARRTILVGETPDAVHIPPGCRFNPRCPLAFDRCKIEEPPLFDVGGGQSAACWLAEGGRELPVMPSAGTMSVGGPTPTA